MRQFEAGKLNIMLGLMFAVCCLTAGSIAAFVWLSTERICSLYSAHEFLNAIQSVPQDPFSSFLKICFYMTLLGVSYMVRTYIKPGGYPLNLFTYILDFAVSIRIMILLNFNYNGFILWVFANILIYAGKSKWLSPLLISGVLCYTFTGFEVISVREPLYNISDYIGLYGGSVRQYLLLVFNLLSALTIVCFIICCLFIIITKDEKLRETNKLYEKLAAANENLRTMNEELKSIMEENEKMAEIRERNRIAREIHDTMGHTLTGITAGIDACIAIADRDPELMKKQLELISKVSRKGIEDVRKSVSELRPDTVGRFNLREAICGLVENTQRLSGGGTRIEFKCSVPVLKFDEDEENAIYRVVQESITNAIRHGHATEIKVEINKSDGDIELSISDNGSGCENIKEGFGIRHIKERIHMLNGRVSFKSDNGFLVEAVVPIRWGEEYD